MSSTTPEERLRIALDLADAGEQMMRLRLEREHPEWSDGDLDEAIRRWMQHRPGAPFGDHPGPPSQRTLGTRTA